MLSIFLLKLGKKGSLISGALFAKSRACVFESLFEPLKSL